MIRSFRHRGLRSFYIRGDARRVAPEHIAKLTRILGALDRSGAPQDMNMPGMRLHRLSGRLRGYYAVSVSGNWRVTFRFEDGRAIDVDYVDYH